MRLPSPPRDGAIDGLRFVAFLAVFLYHLDKNLLPGGFLGVDVFFVISGYVIVQSMNRPSEDPFTIKQYLLKRYRRLAPALGVVVFTSLICAVMLFPPAAVRKFASDAVSSALWVSNFRFAVEEPYADVGIISRPLLHTWSLGVEAQLYLLAPLLALGVIAVGRKINIDPVRVSLVTSLALFVVGLFASSLLEPEWNFFSPLTRAWEFSFGATLAIIQMRRKGDARFSGAQQTAATLIAIVCLIFAFFSLASLDSGPNLFSLVPVMSAVVIIALSKSNWSAKFLGNRIFSYLGKASYSLYLWHLPVIAFTSLGTFGENRLTALLVQVLLTIILGISTYELVEKRAQKQKKWGIRLGYSTLAVLVVVGLSIFLAGGINLRPGYPTVQDARPADGPKKLVSGGQETITLIGDSQGKAIELALASAAEARGIGLASWNQDGCPPLLGLGRASVGSSEDPSSCSAKMQNDRIAWVLEQPGTNVILVGRYTLFIEGVRFDNLEGGVESGGEFLDRFVNPLQDLVRVGAQRSQIRDSLERLGRKLHKAGKNLVLVYPIPEVGWSPPEYLYSTNLFWPPRNGLTTSLDVYRQRNTEIISIFDQLTGSNIVRVKTEQVFCSSADDRCRTHDTRAIFYTDSSHLSKEGASLLSNPLLNIVGLNGFPETRQDLDSG